MGIFEKSIQVEYIAMVEYLHYAHKWIANTLIELYGVPISENTEQSVIHGNQVKGGTNRMGIEAWGISMGYFT